ncbi:minor capsid protein [Streptomyces diacarni]|uniref:minor capsid protein n=1 Tax=Streptomyces diacarni TaxID=2800381 RepID=UPI0033D675D9
MPYTSALTEGLAQLLAAGGLAVYRPSGIYEPGEHGLVVGVMPDNPDRCTVLLPYPVEDTDMTDAITAVQVRMRAGRDPRPLLDFSDDLFALLHQRRHYELGGVHVALSWRQSEAWIGQDTHGRLERTANYYLRTTRSAPHLYE